MNAPQQFIDAYIECALWAEDLEAYELEDATRVEMIVDCNKFYRENEHDITCPDNLKGSLNPQVQAGHDFWLTRCGHGAGFWDGDWNEPAATRLTDAAKRMGEMHLYEEEGIVYAM
jgi:hypothetical protein